MIRILHIIDQYKTGGPGKTIFNSHKFIDNENFQIHIASFINKESEISEAAGSMEIPFLAIPDNRGIKFQQINLLIRYLKLKSIDILHTHGYKSNILGLIIKVLYPKIKIITTLHGWIANNLRQKIVVKVDQKSSLFFDGVIAVSDSIKNKLPGILRWNRKCQTIHNGIVFKDYEKLNMRNQLRDELKISKDIIVLGVVGRLSPEKGCIEMIDVFYQLSKKNTKISLIFIGEGYLKQTLIKKVNKLKLESKVKFLGYKKNIKPYYEIFDLLICPSRTEGLSNTILEGLVLGIPIVATDVGGNSEIIENNYNGILIESMNVTQMSNAIEKLLLDKQKRLNISKNGLISVKEKFDFAQRMRKIEKFYLKILNSDKVINA